MKAIKSIFVGLLAGAGIVAVIVLVYVGSAVIAGNFDYNDRWPQAAAIAGGGLVGLVAGTAAVFRSGTVTQKTVAGIIASILLWAAANAVFAVHTLSTGENLALPGVIAMAIFSTNFVVLGAIAAFFAARSHA